jgi:hypothetical protein
LLLSVKNKSHGNFRGWELRWQTSIADYRFGAQRISRLLKKNATDMGTSAAVQMLNQKIWLNCYAETRPYEISLTSTDLFFDIKRVSFLGMNYECSLPMG